jgi:AhpD family alkylhydroperoxidase
MEPRIDYTKFSADAFQSLHGLEKHLRASTLGEALLHLIKIRASQINGCAFCLDLHSKSARANGETEQRLYALNAWRDTPYFTPRERAALEWTETLTLIAQTHVSDEVFQRTIKEFDVQELVDLTYAVIAINGWNRLAISMRAVPGQFQPPQQYYSTV